MPKWNCSPLQRFMTCIDLESIVNKEFPEQGPLFWTKKSFGGLERENKAPTAMYRDLTAKEKKFYAQDDPAALERLYRTAQPYPKFCIDGHTHNAIRWLFFQMYDDSHFYYEDPTEHYVPPEDDAAIRRLNAINEDRRGSWSPTEVPGKYRPVSTHWHQRYLIVMLKARNPWTDQMRQKHEFYFRNRFYDEIKYGKERDWSIARWQDHKENVTRTSGKTVSKQNPSARKAALKPFKKIELIFPHVKGPSRLAMVRHYLRGGTDETNQFLADDYEEF